MGLEVERHMHGEDRDINAAGRINIRENRWCSIANDTNIVQYNNRAYYSYYSIT